MYFHASPVKGIKILEPQVSDDKPLIYFSKKRENVLVYLSNAVEKYCKETGFEYSGKWTKWGPYGFTKDGRLCIHEYYPNALKDTYKGVMSYIYSVEELADCCELPIRDAVTCDKPTPVTNCEIVYDAYEAILAAEKEGLIAIVRYEESTKEQLEWIDKTMRDQYEKADQPDYRHFLEGKFPFVIR